MKLLYNGDFGTMFKVNKNVLRCMDLLGPKFFVLSSEVFLIRESFKRGSTVATIHCDQTKLLQISVDCERFNSHKYKKKLAILQSIGIIVIKSKEIRVVTYTCRYSGGNLIPS